MPIPDDEPRPRLPVAHEIGADLSALSVDELHERVSLLRAEIERLEAAHRSKSESRTAADAVFKI